MYSDDVRVNADMFPSELVDRPQWVCWRSFKRDNGSIGKLPLNPTTGKRADVSNPTTWADFGTTAEVAHAEGFGIGFVFGATDPYVGIDLDHCREPSGGLVDAWAIGVLDRFDTYAEVSPSGTGIHLIARGVVGNRPNKVMIDGGKVEVYDRARFFTMSGQQLKDAPLEIAESQIAIDSILGDDNPESVEPNKDTLNAMDYELPVIRLDQEVLRRARKAKNGAKFDRLWSGDLSDYDGDHSDADLALCRNLAYWTWLNAEQMDRLFRESALFRAKWNDRPAYRESTIAVAIESARPDVLKMLEERAKRESAQAPQQPVERSPVRAPNRKPRTRRPKRAE